ncbi:O-acetyl-ADP-ribose deacetylase [Fusobacterium sp. PH5-44]|uniref:O-acetyl-ADP-ribose deacetylase n=1 Tax=unclassified Fusobacterium TaxID=2648384 RepID=UPI003D219A89
MSLKILQGDITKISVDIIVNAANSSLLGGGGVDGAIHRAGGPNILEECRAIRSKQGGCPIGEAVITTAGNLDARYVIHTVGPVWNGGTKNEKELLTNCYRNSLQLAVDNNCKSIAFPLISSGVYRYPKEEALKVATNTINDFISKKPMEVLLVLFDKETYELGLKIINN